MKKITKLHYVKPNGIVIDIEIERVYGTEIDKVSLDGDVFDSSSFKNSCSCTIDISGKVFCHETRVSNPIEYNDEGIPYFIAYVADKPKARIMDCKRCRVVIEKEWAEEIEKACTERLTDELTPEEREEISDAKIAIKGNYILPAKELRSRKKKFDDMYNEGHSGGYNPYKYYMSEERVEEIKAKYPEHFT